MDYCKYHATSASTFRCSHCAISFCDDCVQHTENSILCCLCNRELESLGAGGDITPFWRRLDQAFKYPVNRETLSFIIVVSLISSLGVMLGGFLNFVLGLIITAITTKYSFLCLQETAEGCQDCPDVRSAYSGGFKMILQIIVIFIAISLMIYGVSVFLGEIAFILFTFFWVFSLPAVFISYARSESIWDAINPIVVTRLIIALGGSYLLLLLFLGIMVASVGTLNHLLGEFYFFSAVLQNIVSYYYMVVMFHLMGYLLYQKQKQLGFVSRLQTDDPSSTAEAKQANARFDVLAKEGRFSELEFAFRDYLRLKPKDLPVFQKMMDFLVAARKYDQVDKHLTDYLNLIREHNNPRQAITLYQKMIHFKPDYQPSQAEQRFELAKLCDEAGKPALTVKLISGIHQDHPQFKDVLAAYELLHKALSEMPGKDAQAAKYRQLIEKLSAATAQ